MSSTWTVDMYELALAQWRDRPGVDQYVCDTAPEHGPMAVTAVLSPSRRLKPTLTCLTCRFSLRTYPHIVQAAYTDNPHPAREPLVDWLNELHGTKDNPRGKYENAIEADLIILSMHRPESPEEMRMLIWEVFVAQYDERLAGPESIYDGVARKLWAFLHPESK